MTDEDRLSKLCEEASHEQDSHKLIALTKEIIALLDAKRKKQDAWKAGGKVACQKDKCDSQDLTFHTVLSDGVATVRQILR